MTYVTDFIIIITGIRVLSKWNFSLSYITILNGEMYNSMYPYVIPFKTKSSCQGVRGVCSGDYSTELTVSPKKSCNILVCLLNWTVIAIQFIQRYIHIRQQLNSFREKLEKWKSVSKMLRVCYQNALSAFRQIYLAKPKSISVWVEHDNIYIDLIFNFITLDRHIFYLDILMRS